MNPNGVDPRSGKYPAGPPSPAVSNHSGSSGGTTGTVPYLDPDPVVSQQGELHNRGHPLQRQHSQKIPLVDSSYTPNRFQKPVKRENITNNNNNNLLPNNNYPPPNSYQQQPNDGLQAPQPHYPIHQNVKASPSVAPSAQPLVPRLNLSAAQQAAQVVQQIPSSPLSPPPLQPQNWREAHSTLTQGNKFMLTAGLLLNKYSDCSFIVGSGRELVEAHRFILITRSDVLENLLDVQSTIEVAEVSVSGFKGFLHFLYTDEFIVANEDIGEVFHLSHKFNVPLLKQKCSAQIGSRMSVENCIDMYQTFGRRYDPGGLAQRALDFIIKNFGTIMQRADFLQFDAQSLQAILVSDDIGVEEIDIFEALLRWTDYQCDLNGCSKTSVNRRQAIDSLIPLIRFPLMPANVFASRVATLQILTQGESMDLFMYLNAPPQQRLGIPTDPFNKTPRRAVQQQRHSRDRENRGVTRGMSGMRLY